jgi:hypothetical protein
MLFVFALRLAFLKPEFVGAHTDALFEVCVI